MLVYQRVAVDKKVDILLAGDLRLLAALDFVVCWILFGDRFLRKGFEKTKSCNP